MNTDADAVNSQIKSLSEGSLAVKVSSRCSLKVEGINIRTSMLAGQPVVDPVTAHKRWKKHVQHVQLQQVHLGELPEHLKTLWTNLLRFRL